MQMNYGERCESLNAIRQQAMLCGTQDFFKIFRDIVPKDSGLCFKIMAFIPRI